ncbi:protein angel homolog 2 [Colossoma macropomum]|uniref:protein angel homolog 2 n=1 Tax=Colossoma macropomum TaxID=42526 RepID=UPI0018641DE2|nr:protein angel homolog 2 [Colossoma macropomum]XP_036437090.1 protein angel homolog 2 [Colossoma macropomum]XP_036437091.1 protein angel homolog 2 [Colossoma macropomum]
MLVRPLSAVGSAQTVVSLWRLWHQPRCSWLVSHSCQRQLQCHTTSKKHSTYSWNEWRRPGVLPNAAPRGGFHLSAGRMDRSDKEPPLKRRKSAEDKGTGEQVKLQHSSKRSAQREHREASPSWLRNVIGVPLTPGKFPPSPESKAELRRHWEDLSVFYDCEPQSDGSLCEKTFDFSVMSYNILSQELLLSNAYLYKHCNPRILEWRHRFTNIIKELEQYSADIMCLQEVQEDHYQRQIKPRLESLGYHCEYKRRTGRKPDGCAVVFKRNRFSLLSCHTVEYFRRGIPLLDRDNVGLILLLQPVGPSGSACRVCVANTHLLYNPRRGDIKLAQLAMLLAEINRVAQLADGRTCPVLLCGDFNSVPWSPLYSFIKESQLEYVGMPIGKVSGQEESSRGQRILTAPIWPPSLGISQQCQYEHQPKDAQTKEQEASLNGVDKARIEHGLKLTSAYAHKLKGSRQPEITTCHSRSAITVDYIFYSATQDESVKTECSVPAERGLQLLARLALVGEAELREVNGLPNEHNSSDHLPLIAQFRLHS